ncbi:MAG: hypothetical protein FWB98_04500 [Defluviitaleaceae bacterium]|nr:hypothetical protein [Defluviitaleaceae bacterium]
MNKSVFGLSENWAAFLAYVFGFVSGIVVLIMEKENKFVRFAALQSTVVFLVFFVVNLVLGILSGIWIIGWIFAFVRWAMGIATFATWLYLIITAASGRAVKLPIIGDICWEQVHK